MDGLEGTRFVVAGTGRVAHALVGAFEAAGARLVGVTSRDPERARAFADACGVPAMADGGRFPATDAVLVLSEDGGVESRALALAARAGPGLVWSHMAGSLPATVLAPAARLAGGGEILAFHPLAVLDGRPRDLANVTVTLEGSAAAVGQGRTWATALGARPVEIAGADRHAYHLAACLAAGHLMGVLGAARAVTEAGRLPAAVGEGLLHLAAEALAAYAAEGGRAVTGPLARGDLGTVTAHLAWLRTHAEADIRHLYGSAGLLALAAAQPASGAVEERRASVVRRLREDLAEP